MTRKEALKRVRGYLTDCLPIDDNGELDEIMEALEQEPCEDCVNLARVYEIMGNLMSIPYDFDRNITEQDVSESMDRIRELSSVQPKTGWIPVSERLPEEKGCYLATVQGFGYHTFIKVVNFATNLSLVDKYDFKDKVRAGWYDYDLEYGYYEVDTVIAWQPLSQPYKAESEG